MPATSVRQKWKLKKKKKDTKLKNLSEAHKKKNKVVLFNVLAMRKSADRVNERLPWAEGRGRGKCYGKCLSFPNLSWGQC